MNECVYSKENGIKGKIEVIKLFIFSSIICVIFAFSQMLSIPALAYIGSLMCFGYVILGDIDNVLLFIFFLALLQYIAIAAPKAIAIPAIA